MFAALLFSATVAAGACQCEETEPLAPVLEVSFGQSQLFIRDSTLAGDTDKLVPVSSALFLAEYLMKSWLSVAALVNLPLTSHKSLVDGRVVEEHAAAATALGLRATPLSFEVLDRSNLEVQLALLLGRTLGSVDGDRFFPLLTGRVHFSTHEGFSLYMGTAFAFAKDTTALIYGVGHRF